MQIYHEGAGGQHCDQENMLRQAVRGGTAAPAMVNLHLAGYHVLEHFLVS